MRRLAPLKIQSSHCGVRMRRKNSEKASQLSNIRSPAAERMRMASVLRCHNANLHTFFA